MATSTKRFDAGRVPGPAAVPGVVEIMCTFQLPNGKLVRGAFHGFNSGSTVVNQALANSLFSSISAAWNSNLATYMHTGTSFQYLTVRDMTSPTNPLYQSTGAAVVGTGSGAAMPPGAAIVMTENIAARGRGAKGRFYLGGWVTSADVTTGGINTTVQTAINNFGTAVYNAITGAPLVPCVAQPHRQAYTGVTGTQHNDRPAGHVNVTSYVCRDLLWDSQRRRAQL